MNSTNIGLFLFLITPTVAIIALFVRTVRQEVRASRRAQAKSDEEAFIVRAKFGPYIPLNAIHRETYSELIPPVGLETEGFSLYE